MTKAAANIRHIGVPHEVILDDAQLKSDKERYSKWDSSINIKGVTDGECLQVVIKSEWKTKIENKGDMISILTQNYKVEDENAKPFHDLQLNKLMLNQY